MEPPRRWKPFSITYVEYQDGDPLSFLLAISSLAPVALIVGFVTLILFKRDLHTMCFFAGQVGNELLNSVLKNWVREPRPSLPDFPASHAGKFGWPSNHSQFIAFFSTYAILFILIRLKHSPSERWSAWKLLLSAGLLALAAVVMVGRTLLGQHTSSQVVAGCIIGATSGFLWFAIVHWKLSRWFPTVVSWRVCEWLLVRDYTPIPSVLFFDYACARNECRARARKHSHHLKHN